MLNLSRLLATLGVAFVSFAAISGCAGNGARQLIATQKVTIDDLDESNSSHTLTLVYCLYSDGRGEGTFTDSSPYAETVQGTVQVWRNASSNSFRFLARYKGRVARGEVADLPANEWKTITVNYYEVEDGKEADEPSKTVPYDILLEDL